MWVSRIGLTHSMLVIHPSFTQSKWNMGEICGLKFHLFHAYTSNFLPSKQKGPQHFPSKQESKQGSTRNTFQVHKKVNKKVNIDNQ